MSSPNRGLGMLTALVIVSLQETAGMIETGDSTSRVIPDPPPRRHSFAQSKVGDILTRHSHAKVHTVSGKRMKQGENVKGVGDVPSNSQSEDLIVGDLLGGIQRNEVTEGGLASQDNRDYVPDRILGEETFVPVSRKKQKYAETGHGASARHQGTDGPVSRNKQRYAETDGGASARHQGRDEVGLVLRNKQRYAETDGSVSGSDEGAKDVSSNLQGNGGAVSGIAGKDEGDAGAGVEGRFTSHRGQGPARDKHHLKRGSRRHHKMHTGQSIGTHDQNRRENGWGGRGTKYEGDNGHDGKGFGQRVNGRRRHFGRKGGRGRDGESHHRGESAGSVSRNKHKYTGITGRVSGSHQGVRHVSGSLQGYGGAVGGIAVGGAGEAAEGRFTGHGGQRLHHERHPSKRGSRWHPGVRSRSKRTHDQNQKARGWGSKGKDFEGSVGYTSKVTRHRTRGKRHHFRRKCKKRILRERMKRNKNNGGYGEWRNGDENNVMYGGGGRRGRGMDAGDYANLDVGNGGEDTEFRSSRGRNDGRFGFRGRRDSRGGDRGGNDESVEFTHRDGEDGWGSDGEDGWGRNGGRRG